MSFLDEFSRKYLDATEVDAIRSLRPGGPLDQLTLTLVCKRCSKEKKEFLRWFHLHDFACQCGGTFDDRPLREALAKMAVDYLMKTRSPEEILQMFDDDDRRKRE